MFFGRLCVYGFLYGSAADMMWLVSFVFIGAVSADIKLM